MTVIQGFAVRTRPAVAAMENPVTVTQFEFKPHHVIGPVTVGESAGRVAIKVFDPLQGEDVVLIFTLAYMSIALILWVVQLAVWWWASSDLKFHDISKFLGLLSPWLGVLIEAVTT